MCAIGQPPLRLRLIRDRLRGRLHQRRFDLRARLHQCRTRLRSQASCGWRLTRLARTGAHPFLQSSIKSAFDKSLVFVCNILSQQLALAYDGRGAIEGSSIICRTSIASRRGVILGEVSHVRPFLLRSSRCGHAVAATINKLNRLLFLRARGAKSEHVEMYCNRQVLEVKEQ